MALGNPITLTDNVAAKVISVTATSGQTVFTVTGGYRINQLGVYRNGVRLVESNDYTASDGASVTLYSEATLDDILAFQIFDDFRVSDAIVSSASTQTISGNLNVTGDLTVTGTSNVGVVTGGTYYGDGSNLTGLPGQVDLWNKTAAGINTAVSVGIGTTRPDSIARVNNTTILNAGIVTAYQFYGDGSNLSGISTAAVPGINTERHSVFNTINVSGIATFGAAIDANSTSNFGDVVTISDTTTSTSSATGALIVTGGVGIGKSLFVSEGISVGGTITYDDVTNVDSVGIVTAGGGLYVGRTSIGVTATTAGHIIAAGVITATSFKGDGSGLSGVGGDTDITSCLFI